MFWCPIDSLCILKYSCYNNYPRFEDILYYTCLTLKRNMHYNLYFCFSPDKGFQSYFLSHWMYPCRTCNLQTCLACSLSSHLVVVAPYLYLYLTMMTCLGQMNCLRLHILLLALLHSHHMHAIGMQHIFRCNWGPCRSECEVVYVIWMLFLVHDMIPLLFDIDLCNSRNCDFDEQLAAFPSCVPWGSDLQLFVVVALVLRPLMGPWEFLD